MFELIDNHIVYWDWVHGLMCPVLLFENTTAMRQYVTGLRDFCDDADKFLAEYEVPEVFIRGMDENR